MLLQAKLHVALDLGEAKGDQGFTFGAGPAAAGGRKLGSNNTDGPTKEIEMQGLGGDSAGQHEDDSLNHNAAQVQSLYSLQTYSSYMYACRSRHRARFRPHQLHKKCKV